MRRILYFAGYRLLATEWNGKQLLASYRFEPTDSGFSDFLEYLEKSVKTPAQLLIDIIEEDFRREVIPAVTGSDRKALIDRRLDRFYREAQYTHVESLGKERDKTGRRNETLLLSALTNIEPLTPWLDLIHQSNTPLIGIWSVPLLSRSLLSIAPKNQQNVLIVTRQVVSSLRESFFRDGRFYFSRQAKIPLELRDEQDLSPYLKNIITETEQTYRFLTNQRIMGFTDTLSVYCVLDDHDVQTATTFFNTLQDHTPASNDNVAYHVVSHSELYQSHNLPNLESDYTDLFYTYLCSRLPLNSDHYFAHTQSSDYTQYMVEKFINWGTFIGGLGLLTAAALLWLNSIELDQERLHGQEQIKLLQQSYTVSYEGKEQQLDRAEQIKSSVEFFEHIIAESNHAPIDFFKSLSAVYSNLDFRDFWLEKLDWQALTPMDIQRIAEEYKTIDPDALKNSDISGDDDIDPYDDYSETAGSSDTANIQVAVTLSGNFDQRSKSYTEVVNTVRRFKDALADIAEVNQVYTRKIPVDVRAYSMFKDQNGNNITLSRKLSELIKNSDYYEFTLILNPLES